MRQAPEGIVAEVDLVALAIAPDQVPTATPLEAAGFDQEREEAGFGQHRPEIERPFHTRLARPAGAERT